ncbi:MAG: MBL fold metallo-hydrolase [Actinomycetia bacterium]|nr:MBL fold metallo-hydrolase [Actinomycetes bacterium]
MSYTGNVVVGGPAQVRELPALIISKVAVGPYNNNCYLLRCRRSGAQMLVDAADEPEVLTALVGDDGLESVVTTHRHGDHWQALPAVVGATRPTTIAHPLDAPELPVATDVLVEDGGTVRVGDVTLDVIHLRGHTPGSIALLYDNPDGPPHLFTGDSLFPGGVGKTTPETFAQLIDDVSKRVFARLPDETWFYPGHGNDSTLGTERPHLDEWRQRGW